MGSRIALHPRWLATVAALALVAACSPSSAGSPIAPPPPARTTAPTPGASGTPPPQTGSVILVGRIMTMDTPAIAEALRIDAGVVTKVGTRDEVVADGDADVPVIDIGTNVAYPGFIDAHAHWIGDRDIYGVDTPAEAMDLAVRRGWTSISEQWVNQDRLRELTTLAGDDALRLRVDAYLALNFDKEFYGDWYADRKPGVVADRLRVQGVKIHLDTGDGTTVNWEPAELTTAIGRANRAGWQVSVHSMSSAAQGLVLDAFEAALGPTGPNPLHHRIEHATQVTDDELARMVALDLATVIHLDGEADWIMYDGFLADFDRKDPPADIKATVGRWRDFVDAGLPVASATDAPWTFPDFQPGDRLVELTDDVGRPVDQIASGMDGKARMNPRLPGWLRDQTLTAEQGLRAVTRDAAWALGDDGRRGHLAPGTLGDVTILGGDVTDATPDEIRAMDVVSTIVGGVPVYCPDSEICAQLANV